MRDWKSKSLPNNATFLQIKRKPPKEPIILRGRGTHHHHYTIHNNNVLLFFYHTQKQRRNRENRENREHRENRAKEKRKSWLLSHFAPKSREVHMIRKRKWDKGFWSWYQGNQWGRGHRRNGHWVCLGMWFRTDISKNLPLIFCCFLCQSMNLQKQRALWAANQTGGGVCGGGEQLKLANLVALQEKTNQNLFFIFKKKDK